MTRATLGWFVAASAKHGAVMTEDQINSEIGRLDHERRRFFASLGPIRYNIVQRLVHRWLWYPRSEWYIESELGSIGPFETWTEANAMLAQGWGEKPSLIICSERYLEPEMYGATKGGVQCPPRKSST